MSNGVLMVNPAGRVFVCPAARENDLLRSTPDVRNSKGQVLERGFRLATEEDREAWLAKKAAQKEAREARIANQAMQENAAAVQIAKIVSSAVVSTPKPAKKAAAKKAE